MKRKLPYLLIPCTILLCLACQADRSNTSSEPSLPASFPELSGPFLGQGPAPLQPELFAPGIVSTGMFTRDVAIGPQGKELYFCVSIANYTYSTILYSREEKGRWTEPEIVPFSGGPGVMDFEPAFSADGSRLYFLSTRPDGDEDPGDQDIWYVERQEGGWGEPINPGPPVNTDGGEFFPSLTQDGSLYFSRNAPGSGLNQIFRSRMIEGVFQEAELLPEQVNCGTNRFNAYIAPDESYLIVPAVGMPDSYDGVDYYIVFRNEEDQWSEPVNMGPEINQDNARGWSPYVSPDGTAFFFMATRTREVEASQWNYAKLKELYSSPGNGNADIYWVDAGLIHQLRKSAVY